MPHANWGHLQIEPALTALITLGQAQHAQGPGSRLFRNLPTGGSPIVKYIEWDPDLAAFDEIEVRRGPTQEFGHSRPDFTTRIAETDRLGHGSLWDWDELANAHARLRLPTQIAAWGRRVVETYKEGVYADVANDPSSYGVGHTIPIPGGEEWNASGGDPRSVINSAADLIYIATGHQKADLSLYLSRITWEALQFSPDWREFLVGAGNSDLPNDLRRAAAFLGVREVWTVPWRRKDLATGDLVDAYQDVAILYTDSGNVPAGLDTTFGDFGVWGVNWELRPAFAGRLIRQDHRTSNLWTWTAYFLPAIINPGSAVYISNTTA
jgi:hypothetical protein